MTDRFLKSTYLDKGTDLSVSSLTKPNYQLWLHQKAKNDIPKEKYVSFKSAIGSAWHEFCEKENEVGAVKEFSYTTEVEGVTLGGTADELLYKDGKWELRDHKTKGVYSAKKFLGIGTKANPEPPKEQEKEILQLSIYRWLLKDLFPNISDVATIYLWVMGHTSREKFPEVSEVQLKLKPIEEIDTYIRGKIKVATSDSPPEHDCPKWLCGYCEAIQLCPHNIQSPF